MQFALQRTQFHQTTEVMNEELQNAVDAGKLSQAAAEALEKLAPGEFCQHKSWGFGKIAEWNLITGQVIIDFKGKKGHPMQAQYAAETLTHIPAGHILARKAVDPAAVKAEAAEDPVGLTRSILNDFGGKATVEQITTSLVPEVFDAPSFKKWWDAAKKKLKADGHFQLPAKKTDPVVLLASPEAPTSGLLERFRAARHLKDQIAALDQIVKALPDFTDASELQVLVTQIEAAAAKVRRLQPAQALEMLQARDEIIARHPAIKTGEGAPSVAEILKGEQPRLQELFAALPAIKQKKAVEQFPVAFGDEWLDVIFRVMQEAPNRLVVEISRIVEKEGRQEDLRLVLARWISERSASSEMLIWLCKERGASYPELFNHDLLGAVFSALERDQLAEKRGARLHDLLFEDRELIGELLTTAEHDEVRDALRRLLLTPVFEDLSKRSLLARIVKIYPELQSMITGDSGERQETLTVSWASLEKRKEEHEDLVNRQIPQNIRDIQIARSYGDLRENFEFKSAKEQQRVLARRRAESERDLGQARGTNFENPDTTQVSIGTVVTLKTPDGAIEVYSILGAWDSAPELGIVSYKAAIGQALLGKKVGESVQLPAEFGVHNVTIEKIEPFTNLDILAEKVHVLAKPSVS
ncbi:transcription elongation factor, GreA/GreB family [Terrimicrobium sacchariphilum]|uniref:Transcription elongation factor, GreA/GreB family n=2 Tax=Terrimicrobium sacchariphilum TaxID=690879 RepID=A0A146G741_TERSA|nr:transcription elongation factor, GreA/GreB family [Terrimicrobium sacchariphilum]